MVAKFCKYWSAFRRRRAFAKIRREFAKVGYPLDGLSDAQVEFALTNGEGAITEVVLSAKIIHHALRRLIKRSHQRSTVLSGAEARVRAPVPHTKGALSR